jgi:hypothetical protein
VWLRQTRKDENGDARFFSPEVSILLDNEIRKSRQLQRKYQPWAPPVADGPVTQAQATAQENTTLTHYADWGEF